MRWLPALMGLLAIGCGGDPAPPTVNAANEKEAEEANRKAGLAEGKVNPGGKQGGKWQPHPDDE